MKVLPVADNSTPLCTLSRSKYVNTYTRGTLIIQSMYYYDDGLGRWTEQSVYYKLRLNYRFVSQNIRKQNEIEQCVQNFIAHTL